MSSWTQVSIEIESVAFLLRLGMRDGDAGGGAGSFRTGDDFFDDTFVVDAAPIDVARELLRPAMRIRLLLRLPLQMRIENGRLTLAAQGEIQREGWMRSLEDLAAMIARDVTAAYARADEKVARESASYRGSSLDDVHRRRAEEIHALRARLGR